ncbi:hypothetical protein OFO07_04715 [Campylobacter sp. JMF_06 NA1]|uniref:hypothetical protein n=1 Tax=Campylobacter sp. JMF_06 NA1 TaxID=2983823 RepID=UPI0022E9CE55|nr:hypothetical protein [Campylobacter sp. JMF_06 NA1]MDA3078220.1 hypothetical protein [Campylobacter sp. JMF_06 NA1]
MRKIALICAFCACVFGAEFTPMKVSPQKTEQIMQDLHKSLEACKDGARIKALSKELEKALFPLEDLDFAHEYDPAQIDELRRIDRENKAFLTKFAITSGCKLADL